jgi:hypothetical protein
MRGIKIEEWSFRSEKVCWDRIRLLTQEFAWDDIIQRISDEMIDIKFRWKNGEREAVGKHRAEFLFSVSPNTQDLFFNSAYGYRAMYYLAPHTGVECNRDAIDSIKGRLIAAAKNSGPSMPSSQDTIKSLEYGSAKIWISEDDSTLDQTSRDRDSILALEVPRWVEAMNSVFTAWKAGHKPTPSVESRALLGVQAPEGHRLKVVGAWMNNDGDEFVVPSKVCRAEHIHQYGFS